MLCFTLYLGVISKYKPPRWAYVWRDDVTEGFFALRVRGAYIWRGLYKEGIIFGNFTVVGVVYKSLARLHLDYYSV